MNHRLTAATVAALTLALASVAVTGADAAPPPAAAATGSAAPAALRAARAAATTRHLSRHERHMRHRRLLAKQRAARAAAAAASSRARARVVAAAEHYLGQPYRYGALDCSGLTQRAFAAAGVHLPRTAAAQAHVGHATSSPRPGDLLVYAGATHVAVVAAVQGRAVTDTIVAPHTGTVVKHQRPYTTYQVRAVLT